VLRREILWEKSKKINGREFRIRRTATIFETDEPEITDALEIKELTADKWTKIELFPEFRDDGKLIWIPKFKLTSNPRKEFMKLCRELRLTKREMCTLMGFISA